MMRRQVTIRLAVLILTASSSFISFSKRVLADEAPADSEVKSAANLIPESNPKFGPPDVGSLQKIPSTAPDFSLPEDDSESSSSDQVFPNSKPDPVRKSQRAMLIPTNWSQNSRLIPTEIDAKFDVIQTSDEEPAPESVAHPNSSSAARPKGKVTPSRGIGKSKRAVYTQPQTSRTVAQPQNRSRDPEMIGFFVPLMSVNAPFGVARSPQVAANPASPRPVAGRPAKPTVAEMLSSRVPAGSAIRTPAKKVTTPAPREKVPAVETILPRRNSTNSDD